MSLIECPDCKKEISDSAISCPSCGYPLNVKKQDFKIQEMQSDKITGRSKKPLLVSIISIMIMLNGALLIILSFSGAYISPTFNIILSLIYIVSAPMIWKMKKSGVNLYVIGNGSIAIIQFLQTEESWIFVDFIGPAIFIVCLIFYYKAME